MSTIVGLEERGIKAYPPTPDLSKRSEYYSSDHFQYDAENDQYINTLTLLYSSPFEIWPTIVDANHAWNAQLLKQIHHNEDDSLQDF